MSTQVMQSNILDLLNEKRDNEQARARRLAREQEIGDTNNGVKKIKKLTAGALVAKGRFALGHVEFEHAAKYAEAKQIKEDAKDNQKRTAEMKRYDDVITARSKPESEWGLWEFQRLCLYKKHKGDEGLKKDLEAIKEQYAKRKNRQSPPKPVAATGANAEATVLNFDEYDDGDDDNEEETFIMLGEQRVDTLPV